jgi:hypothetical protein
MGDFENAKFYQIDGCDRYETPVECLERFARDCGAYDDNGRVHTRCLQPLTVNAYRLAERRFMDLGNLSHELLTVFEERYAEANLGVTDDIDELIGRSAYQEARGAIWEALEKFEATLPVTRVEDKPCASRTYSVDEIAVTTRQRALATSS